MNLEKYTKTFKAAEKQRREDEEKYRTKHVLEGKPIYSTEHPDFFKISATWEKLRKKIDTPLLKKAYYKVGDELHFVKKNTYDDRTSPKVKEHWLIDKNRKCFALFDANDPELEVEDQIGETVYYENILSKGIVTEIKTSGTGNGDILYCFKSLTPPCPVSNPYVLEKDVITVKP